jgi:hypothetical protein
MAFELKYKAKDTQNLVDIFANLSESNFDKEIIKTALEKLTQYDKLLTKVGIKGVRTGVILWFVDHHKVLYVPISSIQKTKEDGKKSVNVKMLDTNEYNIKIIPSVKKRTFLTCDYTVLKELVDGE